MNTPYTAPLVPNVSPCARSGQSAPLCQPRHVAIARKAGTWTQSPWLSASERNQVLTDVCERLSQLN